VGHCCWGCGRKRPNEKFSGRGHKHHICKDCARLPRVERDRIQALLEIEGFLNQSHISAKNISRLKALARFPDQEVRDSAELLVEIARVAPHKHRRRGYVARHRSDLFERIVRKGLFLDSLTGMVAIAPAADTVGEDIDDLESAF
jgi:hypothetical protein